MRHFYTLILVLGLFFIKIKAQQFPQYTQFIFNKIGYNPAASGTSINAPYEVIFGARTQWIGLKNNPKNAFFSFNYNLIPTRSYKKWHNIGIYLDQDQNGNFIHNDVWLSYTFHLLLNSRWMLSAGIFAGIKQYQLSRNNLDKADPAVQKSAGSVFAYPDVVPGIRLSNKKFFIDMCLQQATIYKQSGLGGQIGSPSKTYPNYNFSMGKKGKYNDFNTLMFAVNLRGSFTALPSIELNVMNYYDKKIAFGASIRSKNFISAIFQIHVLGNVNVGLAYDLSINKLYSAAANTGEIMISFSPIFGGELIQKTTKKIVDQCSF
jgi:type IX secretion system PorP/SprF family membrane protein